MSLENAALQSKDPILYTRRCLSNGLLLGFPRSGKSSIANALESENSFVQCQFHHSPRLYELSALEERILNASCSLDFIIFLLDLQQEIGESTCFLSNLLTILGKRIVSLDLMIALHKHDEIPSSSESSIAKIQQEIESSLCGEGVGKCSKKNPLIRLSVHRTSIYNDSLNRAIGELLRGGGGPMNDDFPSSCCLKTQGEQLAQLLKTFSQKHSLGQAALIDSQSRIIFAHYAKDQEHHYLQDSQIISLVDMHCDLIALGLEANESGLECCFKGNTLWKLEGKEIYASGFGKGLCFLAFKSSFEEADWEEKLEGEMQAFSELVNAVVSGIELNIKVLCVI